MLIDNDNAGFADFAADAVYLGRYDSTEEVDMAEQVAEQKSSRPHKMVHSLAVLVDEEEDCIPFQVQHHRTRKRKAEVVLDSCRMTLRTSHTIVVGEVGCTLLEELHKVRVVLHCHSLRSRQEEGTS